MTETMQGSLDKFAPLGLRTEFLGLEDLWGWTLKG